MRAVWKGSFLSYDEAAIKRSSTILNTMFKKKLSIHNGKDYKILSVGRFMLGLKIGQFIFNRKLGSIHKKKKNDKKKKK